MDQLTVWSHWWHRAYAIARILTLEFQSEYYDLERASDNVETILDLFLLFCGLNFHFLLFKVFDYNSELTK